MLQAASTSTALWHERSTSHLLLMYHFPERTSYSRSPRHSAFRGRKASSVTCRVKHVSTCHCDLSMQTQAVAVLDCSAACAARLHELQAPDRHCQHCSYRERQCWCCIVIRQRHCQQCISCRRSCWRYRSSKSQRLMQRLTLQRQLQPGDPRY